MKRSAHFIHSAHLGTHANSNMMKRRRERPARNVYMCQRRSQRELAKQRAKAAAEGGAKRYEIARRQIQQENSELRKKFEQLPATAHISNPCYHEHDAKPTQLTVEDITMRINNIEFTLFNASVMHPIRAPCDAFTDATWYNQAWNPCSTSST